MQFAPKLHKRPHCRRAEHVWSEYVGGVGMRGELRSDLSPRFSCCPHKKLKMRVLSLVYRSASNVLFIEYITLSAAKISPFPSKGARERRVADIRSRCLSTPSTGKRRRPPRRHATEPHLHAATPAPRAAPARRGAAGAVLHRAEAGPLRPFLLPHVEPGPERCPNRTRYGRAVPPERLIGRGCPEPGVA